MVTFTLTELTPSEFLHSKNRKIILSSRCFHSSSCWYNRGWPTDTLTKFKLRCSVEHATSDPHSETDLKALSPRDRRRLRASRRREKLELSSEDSVDPSASPLPLARATRLPPVSKSEFFELEHLKRQGDQWYMLHISNTLQEDTLLQIRTVMTERFPQTNFELFFPTYPEGPKSSPRTVLLEPEGIFIHVTMTDAIYKALYRLWRVRQVFGRMHKRGKSNIMIPTPVADTSIMRLKRMAEEGHKKFLESAEEESPLDAAVSPAEVEASRKPKKESIRKHLLPGTLIRIAQGPFRNFKAEVVELVPRKKKVTVNIEVLGTLRTMVLSTENVELVVRNEFGMEDGFEGAKTVPRSERITPPGFRRRRESEEYE